MNVSSPSSPTPAKSNSTKKALNFSNQLKRFGHVVHRRRLSSTGGDTSAFSDTLVDRISRSNTLCFVPHAPYTVNDAGFERVRMLADQLDLVVHCHIHETAHENAEAMKQHGMRQLARLDRRRVVQAGVNSFSQMVDLLAETDLIAVFPQRVARRYLHALGSRPLPLELPDYRLHACWHKRSEADEAVVWLRGQVIEAIERTL